VVQLFTFKLLLALLGPLLMQSSIPVSEEPRHHVVFENAYVRVLDAVVRPGDTTLFHTHVKDNVPVAIRGGEMRTEVLGGKTTESDVPTGGIWFAKASYSHRIGNIGSTPLRFIDAEILGSPGSPPDLPPLDKVPGHELVLENDRVRVYRVVLGPGEATGMHTHAPAGLQVAVTAGKIAIRSGESRKEVQEVKAGEFAWHGSATTQSVENAGTGRYEVVEIDWK
jgi:quercetin dioxygenase-like cupin family protein